MIFSEIKLNITIDLSYKIYAYELNMLDWLFNNVILCEKLGRQWIVDDFQCNKAKYD